MLKRFLPLLLIGLCLLTVSAGVSAAVEVKDLGDGLSYLRVRSLDKTLPAALPTSATAIDLRGTIEATPEALATLRDWLAQTAQRPLRLFLVDSTTRPEILEALERRQRYGVTLAAASPALTTDIAVNTPLSADQQAREALDHGKPIKDVLAPRVEKRRYDEAAMVRDHASGVPVPDSPPDLSDATPTETAPTATTEPTPPSKTPVIFDAVLQRAIHFHRALAGLKKL
ncbi:MAG TPA: hypothetical protein PLN52_04200 [Opitutaceae bacterium]|nr:hypothetical protein [Opitutaceae bacterium]